MTAPIIPSPLQLMVTAGDLSMHLSCGLRGQGLCQQAHLAVRPKGANQGGPGEDI